MYASLGVNFGLKTPFLAFIVLLVYFAMYGTVRYGTVRFGTVRYGTVHGTSKSIPHVMRIIAFRIFFVFVTIFSSLHCCPLGSQISYCYTPSYVHFSTVTMLYCCPRSSAAARILRPSTTAAPNLLASALLGATIPYIFLFTSDNI